MHFRFFVLGLLPMIAVLPQVDPTDLGPPVPAVWTAGPAADLSGSWVLNAALSRSRGRRLSEAGADGDGGFSRPVPGVNRALLELLRPKQRLSIAQSDTAVTVTDDAGWIRLLLPSGRRVREELGQGGPAEIETRWKGDKLVTERWLEIGGRYAESYELNRKTGRLTVKVSFQTERMPQPVESSLVYEREPGSQGRPPPGY